MSLFGQSLLFLLVLLLSLVPSTVSGDHQDENVGYRLLK